MTRSERLFSEGKCDTMLGVACIITPAQMHRMNIRYYGSDTGLVNGEDTCFDIYTDLTGQNIYVCM